MWYENQQNCGREASTVQVQGNFLRVLYLRDKSPACQRWITVHQRGYSIKQLLKWIIVVADSESGQQISKAEDERKSFSDASFTDEVQCSSRLQWGPGGECSCVAPPSRVYLGRLCSAFLSCSSNQSGTGPKTDSNWFSTNFIKLVLLTFVDILTEQQSTGEGWWRFNKIRRIRQTLGETLSQTKAFRSELLIPILIIS